MKKIIFLAPFILLLSCSQLNKDSKVHYESKTKTIRHGIIVSKNQTAALEFIDEKAAKRGKKVYEQNCFSCHGAKGYGDGPDSKSNNRIPKNLTWIAETVPNFKFYMLASQWSGDMPGWSNILSDKDLRDVEHYIRTLAKANN